ncbi:MAG TPA: glycosyltransferase family 87 protein, partial [Candidatus Dormibacteraeota bacterium]|nr:glycosyltransferase family 87 protein [Candidatus Dormibacteraeota bacterium]
TLKNPRMRIAIALVLLAGGIGYQVLASPGYLHMYDFRFDFIPASREAWSGHSPYQRLHVGPPGTVVGAFLDTPVLLWLLGPLAALPITVSQWIWLGLELSALVTTIIVLYRSIGRPRLAELAVTITILCLFLPLKDSLDDGQTGVFVACALACALDSHLRGRGTVAGLFIGFAIAIKAFPVLALVYFIWRRDRAAVVASLVTVGALSGATLLTGWSAYWSPFFYNIQALSNGSAQLLNQSLNGLVLRALVPSAYGSPVAFPGWGVRFAWFATQVALAASVGLTAIKVKLGHPLVDWTRFGLLLLAIPMVLPFAWIHHYAEAVLLIPLWVRAASTGLADTWALVLVVLLLSLSFVLVIPTYFAALPFEGRPIWQHPELLAGSLALLCAVTWIPAHLGLRSGPATR